MLARGRCASIAAAAVWGGLALGPQPRAAQVAVIANRDNSMFADDGNASCGSGPLFSGQTGAFGARRALIHFDVAGAIPAGSTITSAQLDLFIVMSGTSALATDVFHVHRLLADWGEGGSSCGGGNGAAAEVGDVTWIYRFFDTDLWTTAGGDFNPTAGASIPMPLSGNASFPSTAALVADVQGWLDSPASNFGWIVLGDESRARSARLIRSRDESPEPTLTITYSPPPATPPAVPDGLIGSPLRIGKTSPGSPDLVVSWDVSSCAGALDHHIVYGIRPGFPAALGGTYTLQGSVCNVGTSSPYTWIGSPDPASLDPVKRLLYILMVADDDATVEGSWGRSSGSFERNGTGTNGSSATCGILDKSLANTCGQP